ADDIVGRVGKTAQKSESAISGMGSAFGKVAAMAAGYLSVTKVMEGINLASDFTESRNKLEAVFGDQIDDADNFIKEMAATLNLGTRQLEKEMSDVGAMMKGIGFEDANLNLNTENVLKGAKDIASFYNTDLDSAIKKITGGMAGEAEGLKQLGIMVMDQDMDAYAESLGHSWKEMDNTTKAQLRLNKTLGDLKKAGAYKDAEKTKDEYAAVERSLSSLTQTITGDFFMSLKDALLPGMIQTRDLLVDNKDKIVAFGSKVGEFATTLFKAAGAVYDFCVRNKEVLTVVGGILVAVGSAVTAYKTVMAVTQAWTAVQAAFNVVMMLNPVGLVVAAVVGLGVAVYMAYQHFEPFKAAVDATWESVKVFWGVLTSFDFSDFWGSSTKVAKAAFDVWLGGFKSVLTFYNELWKGLTGFDIMSIVGGWVDKAKDAFLKIKKLIPGFGGDDETSTKNIVEEDIVSTKNIENVKVAEATKNIVEEDIVSTKNIENVKVAEATKNIVEEDIVSTKNIENVKETTVDKADKILRTEEDKNSLNKTEENKSEIEQTFKNISENKVTKVENSHTFDISVNANDSELAAMVEKSTKKAASETIEEYERNKMLNLGLT
ncbi:MAG: hypothetical protein ACRDAS_13920, partial [Cetobacterium sp.]